MTDQADVERGVRAQALLSTPLLVECFDALEQEYVTAWMASQLRDVEGREKLFQAVHVLRAVQSHLEKMIDAGKVAKATIDEIARTPAAHRK